MESDHKYPVGPQTCSGLRLYAEDLGIAQAIIQRDGEVTRQYFYRQCYPLFKSFFNRFVTDCTCCKEFIDEIYLLVMSPSRITGKCKLENFRGESTLASWLKTVCYYYCCGKFEEKDKRRIFDPVPPHAEEDEFPDRYEDLYGFVEMDFSRINRSDAMTVLNMMPNKRYSSLIRLRYLEQLSNEETAKILGMSLDNYYNKHKLAKAQYEQILRKEYHHFHAVAPPDLPSSPNCADIAPCYSSDMLAEDSCNDMIYEDMVCDVGDGLPDELRSDDFPIPNPDKFYCDSDSIFPISKK